MLCCAKSLQSCPILCDPMDSSVLWDSPGKNIGVGCHALLRGIFLTQGSNPRLLRLLHWQVGSLPLAPLLLTNWNLKRCVCVCQRTHPRARFGSWWALGDFDFKGNCQGATPNAALCTWSAPGRWGGGGAGSIHEYGWVVSREFKEKREFSFLRRISLPP